MSRLTPIAMAIGLCTLGACLPASEIKRAVGSLVAEQGAQVAALDGLDATCQGLAHNEGELSQCRKYRDLIRVSMRKQVAAFNYLVR